jgi:hypothetical protein
VVDALIGEVVVVVSGCWFVVIVMSSLIHADVCVVRIILTALVVRISTHRVPPLLPLPNIRKYMMFRQLLVLLLQRGHHVSLNQQFK